MDRKVKDFAKTSLVQKFRNSFWQKTSVFDFEFNPSSLNPKLQT